MLVVQQSSMARYQEDINNTVFTTHPKIVKYKGGNMTYFDDLNPFLVRQDGTTPQANNVTGPANGNTSPTGSATSATPPSAPVTPAAPVMPLPIIAQTYVENILRINIGKYGRFYFSYEDSAEWRDRMYRGVIEQVGRDYFVVHDTVTNKRFLLPLIYFNWAEFDEDLNY